MDVWYSSISNLKLITKKLKWNFICNLKQNRQVSVSQGTYIPIADLGLAERQVRKVWLKEYGLILVCKIVNKNGYDKFTEHFHQRWKLALEHYRGIEEFRRGIKQTTGIGKCYSILAASPLTHLFACFVAFLKLEIRRIKKRISWYEQKTFLAGYTITHYLLANA